MNWQHALKLGMTFMKCSTARNSRVLNGSVLAFNMWAESHQVEHSHDNDDRCGDGCQREAHKRPFNHCLWHSWQPPATWQLLRKQALQWSEGKKRQNAIKQVRATCDFFTVSYLQTACMSDSQLALSRKGICLSWKPKNCMSRTECQMSSAESVGRL